MNAIDELKMLLDGRGVEYQVFKTIRGAEIKFDWKDECDCYCRYVGVDGSCVYAGVEHVEPDQAVDFALGKKIGGETSDGYHTFNELYYHRAVLFSVIVRDHPDHAWKSKKHHDGTMFDGMFIVGIDTPEGQATYHYDNIYWNIFKCRELERAPEWDGHTSDDAIARIAKLGHDKCRFEIKDNCNDSEGTCCDVWFECSGCHARFDYYADEWLMQENYCPACGRKVEK